MSDKEKLVFIKAKDITTKKIKFLGRDYTHPEFMAMIRLMRRGLFMYPDEVVLEASDADAALHGSEPLDKMHGYVVLRGFYPVADASDPRLVVVSDSYRHVMANLKTNDAAKFDNDTINLFSNQFIEALEYLLAKRPEDSVWDITAVKDTHIRRWIVGQTVIQEYAKLIIDDFDKEVIKDLTPVGYKETFAMLVNYAFTLFETKYSCKYCGGFEPLRNIKDKDDNKLKACKHCYNKAVAPRQLKAVTDAPGRNEPCMCGSGKKYKKCCG